MKFDIRDQGDTLTLKWLSRVADDMGNIEDETDPRKWSNIEAIIVTQSQKDSMMTDAYRNVPLEVK